MAKHHVQDLRAPRAQRHADADLLRPPRDGVAHDAVYSDRREYQREQTERRREPHGELRATARVIHNTIHAANAPYRLVTIDPPDRALHRVRDRTRIVPARRAHNDLGEDERALRVRQICLVERSLGQPEVLHRADHADHRSPRAVGRADPQLFANRRLVRPSLARELVVDDDDGGRTGAVLGREVAAREARDPKRLEIARADDVEMQRRRLLRVGLGSSADRIREHLPVAVERRCPNQCRVVHAGHGSDLGERSREHVGDLGLRAVLGCRKPKLKGEHVRRIEAGLHP